MTDAFPNYFSGRLTLSAANTFTTAPTTLPINRIGRISGTRATVLEFLYVVMETRSTDFLANSDEVRFAISSGPTPTAMLTISNSDVIMAQATGVHLAASGVHLKDTIFKFDLQSADGHGQLIAAEDIHVMGDSAGMAAAVAFNWRVYYRFVQIPALEMMGILQSQT